MAGQPGRIARVRAAPPPPPPPGLYLPDTTGLLGFLKLYQSPHLEEPAAQDPAWLTKNIGSSWACVGGGTNPWYRYRYAH